MTHLERNEMVLVYFNIVNNNYQQDLRSLYTFLPKKSFSQLLDFSPKNFTFSKSFDSKFWYINVEFAEQNSKPLEIEDKEDITLVIK